MRKHLDEIPDLIGEFGVPSFKVFMFYGTHGLHGRSAEQNSFLMIPDDESYDYAHFEFVMRAIQRALPVVMESPDDLGARSDLLYGAYLAGVSLGTTSTGLHHKLCHVLGGMFNLVHADTHSVVLPHAVAFNAPALPVEMDRLAGALSVEPGDEAGALWDLAVASHVPTSLAELGLASASDLQLQIGYNTEGTHADRVAFLQETWRDAFGVELEPVGMEFGTYLDRLSSDPFDIFRLGWIADFPHPHNFLFDLLGCTSPNNNVGYCNEDADELMAEAAVESDSDAQIALYNQVQEMQMADVPLMPFRWGGRFTLVKPYVQDLTVTPLDPDAGAHFYSWVTIGAHDEE